MIIKNKKKTLKKIYFLTSNYRISFLTTSILFFLFFMLDIAFIGQSLIFKAAFIFFIFII